MRVVHISSTAIAGAPGMLSDALDDFGLVDSSIHFRAGEPKPERSLFSPNSVHLGNAPIDQDIFVHHFEEADVIHIHNFAPARVIRWMAGCARKNKKFIFQIHSPVNERPMFENLSDYHGVPFTKKITIPHYPARQNLDHVMLPNCLYRQRYVNPIRRKAEKGPLRVFYSPSTHARGRWSEKRNPDFDFALEAAGKLKGVSVQPFENRSPQTLAAYRTLSHVTIDEVVTGSYHLVSYEGLASGTVVINGADALSIASFRIAFRSPAPPFLFARPETLTEAIASLAADRARTLERGDEGRRFFEEWMNPRRVAGFYRSVYDE